MKLCMQKKSILKILGENDKNIKLRKKWEVVLVLFKYMSYVTSKKPFEFDIHF